MELGELVSVYMSSKIEDPYCDQKDSPTNWQAKINEWGTKQNCSGTTLYKNMKADADAGKEPDFLGDEAFVAKPGPGKKWKLEDVDAKHFPIQAHHVIPKNHLPDHAVCTFLAKKYTKHDEYQLTGDAPYDTDHTNNGYCLPYATPLAEWKKAKDDDEKLELCFKVMRKTHRQLHQGSHRAQPYEDVSDDEEAKIHPVGYLSAIDQLLDVVQFCAQEHVEMCGVCKKGKSGGKVKIQPVKAVVKHMDQVSGLVKLLIDANREFISEPASEFGKAKRGKLDIPDWL